MKRSKPSHETEKRNYLRWSVVGLIFIAILIVFAVIQPERLDRDLCPTEGGTEQRTILLVDTSDPLTAKHRSELHRLFNELRSPPEEGAVTQFYVRPGEQLLVYELTNNLEEIEPVVRVCNPGNNPMDWNWYDDLTRGKRFAIQNWHQFEVAITGLFGEVESEGFNQSLILENMAVILPRHSRSLKQASPNSPRSTHLIVFSDLLQNSPTLSHYAPFESAQFPSTDSFTSKPTLRELSTDLTDVRVSLLRLERSKYANYQTKTHYNWWANFIVKSGGRLHYQSSISIEPFQSC